MWFSRFCAASIVLWKMKLLLVFRFSNLFLSEFANTRDDCFHHAVWILQFHAMLEPTRLGWWLMGLYFSIRETHSSVEARRHDLWMWNSSKTKSEFWFQRSLYDALCQDAGANRKADALIDKMKQAQPATVDFLEVLRLSTTDGKPRLSSENFAAESTRFVCRARDMKLDGDKACVLAFCDHQLIMSFE